MRGIVLVIFILAPVFIITSTGGVKENFNKKIENNTEQEWKIPIKLKKISAINSGQVK